MAQVILSDATVVGDVVTCSGTVDGQPSTVTVWLSHLTSLPTFAAKRTYIAAQLKATVPASSTLGLTGAPITV